MSGSSQKQKEEFEREMERLEKVRQTERTTVQNKRYWLTEIERNVSRRVLNSFSRPPVEKKNN